MIAALEGSYQNATAFGFWKIMNVGHITQPFMTNHRESHESHVTPAEHLYSLHTHALSGKTRFTLFGEEAEADKLGLHP